MREQLTDVTRRVCPAVRDIPVARAREDVAGWTVLDGVSARDRLHRTDVVSEPFGYNWFAAKDQDTFCPMGPGVVPEWLVNDPSGRASGCRSTAW